MKTSHLNLSRWLQLLLLLVAVSACTNSKLVLKPLYNRLDNQIRNEFNKLGKFEDWQKQAFENRLQTFHYWHRREELPVYAELLSHVSRTVATRGAVTHRHATNWTRSIEHFVQSFQKCYPAHYSIDLMKTLKPEQITFIERRFARERFKNRTKYESKTRDERMNERLGQLSKWANLAGFRLTTSQKRLIRSHMDETRSLHNEYYRLTDPWNRTLFKTLRNSKVADYEARMKNHLDSLYGLMDTHHAETQEFNREVWRRFIVEFDKSLSREQRSWLQSYFATLGSTLKSISRAKVNFKAHSDTTKGCIPGSGA